MTGKNDIVIIKSKVNEKKENIRKMRERKKSSDLQPNLIKMTSKKYGIVEKEMISQPKKIKISDFLHFIPILLYSRTER